MVDVDVDDLSKKLELFKQFRGLSKDELFQVVTVLIHLNDMLNDNIITQEDLNNFANISTEKQQEIVSYINNKLEKEVQKCKKEN